MAQPFSSLPPEKQEQITRAGLEVFSKNEYKKASTDDIAAKSGISKGPLFYYFKNKCSLYLYLADYVREAITRQLSPESLAPVTDFFEMLEVAVERNSCGRWNYVCGCISVRIGNCCPMCGNIFPS